MPPKFHNDFLINQLFESYLVVILAENLLEFQHSCKTCLSLSKSDNQECNLGFFAKNLLIFPGFLLISSWISTMSGFWNNTKIVSWLPPMLERVFSSWSPEATWGRVYTPLPRNLDFYTWYEAEIYTRNTSWQKMLIEDVIILVTWPTCILQTKKPFLLKSA